MVFKKGRVILFLCFLVLFPSLFVVISRGVWGIKLFCAHLSLPFSFLLITKGTSFHNGQKPIEGNLHSWRLTKFHFHSHSSCKRNKLPESIIFQFVWQCRIIKPFAFYWQISAIWMIFLWTEPNYRILFYAFQTRIEYWICMTMLDSYWSGGF